MFIYIYIYPTIQFDSTIQFNDGIPCIADRSGASRLQNRGSFACCCGVIEFNRRVELNRRIELTLQIGLNRQIEIGKYK